MVRKLRHAGEVATKVGLKSDLYGRATHLDPRDQFTVLLGQRYLAEKQTHGGQVPGSSAQNEHSMTAQVPESRRESS